MKSLVTMMDDLDDVIALLRIDARILSGITGFAEAYALTGPPSSGKSLYTLGLLRMLGQGGEYLAQPVPSVFFTSEPRQDANSSMPVTNQLEGAKLVMPKESPPKPLHPLAVKSILDPRDVEVAARANQSRRKDSTTFGVTWTIVIPSQGGVEFAVADEGIADKILEFRPPNHFVAADTVNPANPRHRAVDTELGRMTDAGELSGEIMTFAMTMYATLAPEVVKGRVLHPAPPNSLAVQAELKTAMASGEAAIWKIKYLEYCADKDASPVPVINKAMKAAGFSDASVRTACGIGPGRHQYRKGPKADHFSYYRVSLEEGDTPKPVRLKTGVV